MTNFAKLTGFVMLAVAGSVSATCSNIVDSIPYCDEVAQITYDNVGFSGTYQAVSYMNSETCECKFTPKTFSGPIAPLNEELSLHFRGPITVKKIAVYQPGGSAKKRSEHLKRHQHHAKRRAAATTTTTVTSTVTVVWEEPTASAEADEDFKGKGEDNKGKGEDNKDESSESKSDKSSPTPVVKPPTQKEPVEETGDGSFVRVGYWSDEGESNGLTFMNHRGGQGSGVFDYCWGNSISYADKTLQSGSAKPQIPDAISLSSNQEFIVMSDTPCSEGDGCGYHLPGIPAYHGFGGSNKIFAFEFSMPAGGAGGFNGNMPAIWALNANIPKTAQYGACSCWDTGCGEFDIFEVLQGKHDGVKTHYHSKQGANGGKYGGGGSPDFFPRPFAETIKVAVEFGHKTVTVTVLPPGTNFGSTTSGFGGNTGGVSALSTAKKGSVFRVPS